MLIRIPKAKGSESPFFAHKVNIISYILFAAVGCIAFATTSYLYQYTQNLLRERLDERLKSTVGAAALLFDGDDIQEMSTLGAKSTELEKYRSAVLKLQSLKSIVPDITFAYIYSKTEDPNVVQFVADADVIALRPSLNFNEDEVTSEGYPGSRFDITDVPKLADQEAFIIPTVDEDFNETIWGTLLSAYSPISTKSGDVVGVLGIDVDITDYERLVKTTFVPFGIFIVLLISLIAILGFFIVKMWGSRVNFFEELDRQKDAVLHMVAHQFRGPVTIINNYSELLLDGTFGELTDEQKENIRTIHAESRKMGSQSDMVLDAAKITLGKLPLEPKPVDLNELLKEIVDEAVGQAKTRKVNLKTSLPKEKLPTVVLDKKYTQLAIDNLLNNAIKYTAMKSEGGNVEFTVEYKNSTLFCSVKDNGIGIPKKDQENMFKELYRASNAGKDGNGLGLHVTKGSIEAQGGKIWFESEEGKGTTFFVEMSLKLVK